MKILFYAHSSTSYGANRSLAELINGLVNYDNRIEAKLIIPETGPIQEELKALRIDYEVIPHFNWFYNKDLADLWIGKNIVSGKLWLLKNKWQKQFQNKLNEQKHIGVIKAFNPDLIYVNSSLSPMGVYMADRLGIQFIWHHRETIQDPITGYYLNSINEFLKYYRKAKIHFYCSEFLKQYYEDRFGIEPSRNVKNAILKTISSKKSESFDPNKIRFGIVGRINHQKNPIQVISVFQNILKQKPVINHELNIYGGGDIQMIKRIQELDDPNVKYHSFTSREGMYNNIDILIVNSKNESFGRVAVEANYAGIPVIARNSGALSELVENERNGWVFNDEVELKTILFEIIENFSIEKYQNYSNSSKEYAKANFSLDEHISLVYEVISSINSD